MIDSSLSLTSLCRLIANNLNARLASPEFDPEVLKLLGAEPGERVLDLGCGDGSVSFLIKAMGADVTGMDIDPDALAKARSKGIKTTLQNMEAFFFESEFDAVFSSAALHWMRRPGFVIESVAGALKPGGRFVGTFAGYGNLDRVLGSFMQYFEAGGKSARHLIPWYMPSADDYRRRLEKGGFAVDVCRLAKREVALDESAGEWVRALTAVFAEALAAGELEKAAAAIEAEIGKNPVADFVTLEFKAVKR